MNEFHVLIAAFALGAVGLAWMCVLLKRELVLAFTEALNGAAREIR